MKIGGGGRVPAPALLSWPKRLDEVPVLLDGGKRNVVEYTQMLTLAIGV